MTEIENQTNSDQTHVTEKQPPAPMLTVTCCFIAGIVSGRFINAHASLWIFLSIATLSAGIAAFKRSALKPASKAMLAAAVVFLGAANITIDRTRIAADDISGAVISKAMTAATIEGKLLHLTRIDQSAATSEFSTFERTTKTIMLVQANRYSSGADKMSDCSGLVRVSVDGMCEYIKSGSNLRISGIIGRFGPPRNPRPENAIETRRQNGVLTHLYTATPQLVKIIAPEDNSQNDSIFTILRSRFQSIASSRLVNNCDDHTAMTLNAIVLGRRDAALNNLRSAMVRSGTAHLLSISGMHLAILAAVGAGIFRLCGASPKLSAIITLIMLSLYLFTVQTRAPVLRGSIILAGCCVATITGRRAFSINMLSTAAFILLAVDPTDLFRAGFQLSFGVTAGLIMIYMPIKKLIFGRLLERSHLMVFDEGQSFSQFIWRSVLPAIVSAISASTAAWLASIPLVWYHFGVFTPLAPLASLLLLPMAAMVLTLGYLKLALSATGALAPLGSSLNGVIRSASDAFSNLAELLGQIGPCFELPVKLGFAAFLTGSAIIIAVMTLNSEKRHRKLIGIIISAILLGCSVISSAFTSKPDKPTFTLLDVRNGQAAMLQSNSGNLYVFDAGSRSLADPYETVLKPAMQTLKVNAPKAVFISHADSDHYNAIAEMLNQRKSTTIYTSDFFGKGKQSDSQLDKFSILAKTQAKWHIVKARDKIELEDNIFVEVLYPVELAENFEAENDLSMALMLHCRGKKILLPGDLQANGQKALASLGDKIRADILVLPHHGSWTAELENFINTVDPDIVLRSSGKRSDGATTKITALTTTRQFYSTDRSGAIMLELDSETISVGLMIR